MSFSWFCQGFFDVCSWNILLDTFLGWLAAPLIYACTSVLACFEGRQSWPGDSRRSVGGWGWFVSCFWFRFGDFLPEALTMFHLRFEADHRPVDDFQCLGALARGTALYSLLRQNPSKARYKT